MNEQGEPYYRRDLALVHHLGFGFHAEACAPGMLELLEPVRARRGLVVEIGCGSGLLTKHLIAAGHRVIATDASPAMLELAQQEVPNAEDVRALVLPDDPIPATDAVVGVGHALNYLHSQSDIERALASIAQALRPGGVLALDLCDLEWGSARIGEPNLGRVQDDWALVTRRSVPTPDRYVREMTIFTRNYDDSWRRDDERHDNVLVDTSIIPELLAAHGVRGEVKSSFGAETLPEGLRAVIGSKAPAESPALH